LQRAQLAPSSEHGLFDGTPGTRVKSGALQRLVDLRVCETLEQQSFDLSEVRADVPLKALPSDPRLEEDKLRRKDGFHGLCAWYMQIVCSSRVMARYWMGIVGKAYAFSARRVNP
jgi:hypothetical protein